MAHYHEVEGRPGLLRTETGDDTTPEGVETRVNEVYRAPLFQIDDIVIRVGKNIHGERNLGEPCTVIFVDKYAKPYHYTVKDPFGQEIGVVETHLMPCEEVMYLADRENAEVVDYESQRKFPEQQTKEGKHQENGFRVVVVPHEEMKALPDELELPVVPAKKKRVGGEEVVDDFTAKLIEQVCWVIIICMGVFWIWVAVRGPGNTIVPMKSWLNGDGWLTKDQQIEEVQQETLAKIKKNPSLGDRVAEHFQDFLEEGMHVMSAKARRQKQRMQRIHRVTPRSRRSRNRVYARARGVSSEATMPRFD